jgi:hypothetical protein
MHGRLVVTGVDAQGQSIVESNELTQPLTVHRAGQIFRYWSAELDGSGGPWIANEIPFFPKSGGLRFFSHLMLPRSLRRGLEMVSGDSAVDTEYLTSAGDPDETGMHATHSIDFVIVGCGEVALELDGGDEVVLTAGDVVVQRGAKHRWRVLGDTPAILNLVVFGLVEGDQL